MGGFLQTATRPSISLRFSTHQFINSATKAANAHAQRQTQTRPRKANLWAPHLPTPQQRHAKSAAGSTPARRTRSRGQLPILPIFSTSRSGVGVGQKKQWAVSAAPPEQKANFPASFGLRHPSVAETLGTHFLSMSPGIGRTRGRPRAERREGRGPRASLCPEDPIRRELARLPHPQMRWGSDESGSSWFGPSTAGWRVERDGTFCPHITKTVWHWLRPRTLHIPSLSPQITSSIASQPSTHLRIL